MRDFYWGYLWKINHNEKITLKGHTSRVYSVAFSADGRTLATGSRDRTVKLYTAATVTEVAAQRNK